MSSPANEPRRLPALDATRFFAACAIVWIHTTDTLQSTTLWCRWAVPFFTIASVWLLGQSLLRRPQTRFADYAWRRTRRLYGTFLVWNLIYLLAIALKHKAFHTGKEIHFVPDLLWGGAAEHLWFLTFLWLATIAAFPICRFALRGGAAGTLVFSGAILAAAASAGIGLSFPEWWNHGSVVFVENVWMTVPAVFLGIALVAGHPGIERLSRSAKFTLAGAVLLGVASFLLFRFDRQSGLEGLAGLGAMMIALSPSDSSAVRRLAALGQFAFGVYIVHVLWVESLQAIAGRAGVSSSPGLDVSIAVAAIALSLVVARLLKNTPLLPR